MRAFSIACLACLIACAAWATDDVLWIDVRSPEEYAAGHLDGAINLPHHEIAQRIAEIAPDRQSRLKLYCRKGARAELAKTALEAQGYARVSNEGGYENLLEARAACGQAATDC